MADALDNAIGMRDRLKAQRDDDARSMTGFIATLTADQRRAALMYRGPESHGDDEFLTPLGRSLLSREGE